MTARRLQSCSLDKIEVRASQSNWSAFLQRPSVISIHVQNSCLYYTCGRGSMALLGLPGIAQPARKGGASDSGPPTYSRDIRQSPIAVVSCVIAPAPNYPAVSGGLGARFVWAIKQGIPGAKSAVVLVPGKSGTSALYERLTSASPARLMPKGGPPLPRVRLLSFKRWIDAGAPSGTPSKDTNSSKPSAEAAPMPPNRPVQDVAIPVKAEFPAGLLDKGPTLLSLRIGPLPPVTALAYSPDGKRLAIGAYRAVAVWTP